MNQAVDKKIERYFSAYPERTYPKGQILIHGGDDPQHIFYLVRGKVRQYDISYRGDEVVVNVYKTGSFFPMLWALTGKPNRYFFSADEEVRVRQAPKDATLDFLRSNPDVTLDLLTRLYVGVDGVLGRMAHLMAGSAKSRLMYELVIECKRFGVIEKSGVKVSLSETELAARAGLTRETVSREIQKLIKAGLVKSSGQKQLLITDLQAMETATNTDI